ncbi:cytochrome c oxidase subunit II [Halovulum sp. GXIMD14794]
MNSTLDIFGSQTTLAQAGLEADRTYTLTVAMSVAGIALLALVMALVALAWRARGGARHWWVIAGGIVLPLSTLTGLFVASTLTLRAIAAPPPEDALTVEIIGHQYWWEIVYDPGGRALRDANELHLPKDRPVRVLLNSADVIHSFWLPSIAGKMDMIPGRTNETTLTALETGRFRGQCAEFCGLSHPLMAFEAVVLPQAEFAGFLDKLEDEARDAVTPQERQGRDVFLNTGCPACHEVRGVAEGGRLGPDLSRVGAREALGAGMWHLNRGTLAGWIADPQAMKPGAEMPAYNHLSGPDLRAVAAWLESLE